jgi:hypothetical protein
MQEGWVEFVRIPCKEGFIDVWHGDCAKNPNEAEKSRFNLNAFAKYFRLNGSGEWRRDYSFNTTFHQDIRDFRSEFTALELWDFNRLF